MPESLLVATRRQRFLGQPVMLRMPLDLRPENLQLQKEIA